MALASVCMERKSLLLGNAGKNFVADHRHVDPRPMFDPSFASDTFKLGLKNDGVPERKVWDVNAKLKKTDMLFRLKRCSHPPMDWNPADGTQYRNPGDREHFLAQVSTYKYVPPLTEPETVADSQPKTRASKYFNLLMEGHGKHTERWANDAETIARDAAEAAARAADVEAKRKRVAIASPRRSTLIRPPSSSSYSVASSQTGSSMSEIPESTQSMERKASSGELVPYYGTMQVEIEIITANSPDMDEDDIDDLGAGPETELTSEEDDNLFDDESGHSSQPGQSRKNISVKLAGEEIIDMNHKSKSKSSSRRSSGSSSPGSSHSSSVSAINLEKELEGLKDELGVNDEPSEDSDEDLPDHLKNKGGDNIWDNPVPAWSLGLGGTVFFVPDAERYSMGSSLPPPPPRSLHGRKRLKLKPRLPLDVSNNRYRDENPNIWPIPPFNPDADDYNKFEEILMTLDFYQGCNVAMSSLPQMSFSSESKRHRQQFGSKVYIETKKSEAWKSHRIRKKFEAEEAKRLANEKLLAEAAKARRAAQKAAASAAQTSDED